MTPRGPDIIDVEPLDDAPETEWRVVDYGALSPGHLYIIALLLWILADVQYLHPDGRQDTTHAMYSLLGVIFGALGLARHYLQSRQR